MIDFDKYAQDATPDQPLLPNGDPVHFDLTEDEKAALSSDLRLRDQDPEAADEAQAAISGLSRQAQHVLFDQIVNIACARGQRALDDLLAALEGPPGSALGLTREAYPDDETYEAAVEYTDSWLGEIRAKVGASHFGCW